MVVEVLQAGPASIMGGGVGASNAQDMQEMWDARGTRDAGYARDTGRMRDTGQTGG